MITEHTGPPQIETPDNRTPSNQDPDIGTPLAAPNTMIYDYFPSPLGLESEVALWEELLMVCL